MGVTHPPLKAPTGFRTGIAVAVASCCRCADDLKVLDVRRGERVVVWRKARIDGARILEAMARRELWVTGWCFEYDMKM